MNIVKSNLCRTALAALCGASLWAAAQSGAQTGSAVKPEDWYKHSDRRALILRDTMLDADAGEVDAMIPLAQTLLSGWGRAEGPHPQAALYWLQAAADRGEHKALSQLALVYAMGEVVPRDEKKANAYLDTFVAKTGKPLKRDACGDDEGCNRYLHLLSTYSSMHIEYPGKARREGLGGEFFAVVDLASGKVKVSGKENLELFEPALRKALEDGAKKIPQPAGLAQRHKSLEMSYDMRVAK